MSQQPRWRPLERIASALPKTGAGWAGGCSSITLCYLKMLKTLYRMFFPTRLLPGGFPIF